MTSNDTNKETTMNATQKMIAKDAAKVFAMLAADDRAEARNQEAQLRVKVAEMMEAAA